MGRIYLTLLYFLVIFIPHAKADVVNDIFRVQCIPELNVLSIIGDFQVNGQLPRDLLKTEKEALANKYGIYDYEDNVLEISTKEPYLQSSKTLSIECPLKATNDIHNPDIETYFVDIKGHFQNSNVMGMCGLWRTVEVSIKTESKTLVDRLPFSLDCQSHAKIYEMKLLPHEEYISVTGNCLQENTFFFSDDLPVTANNTYADKQYLPNQKTLEPEDLSHTTGICE